MRPTFYFFARVALLYLVCAAFWLSAANWLSVAPLLREFLKILCLCAALVVFSGSSLLRAQSSSGTSLPKLALWSGAAVGLGFLLIVLFSAVFFRDLFFHDSTDANRLVWLLFLIVVLTAVSSIVAGGFLWIVKGRRINS